MTRALALLSLLALALLGAACGGSSGGGSTTGTGPESQNAQIVLDFIPNAVHAGLYAAVKEGLDRKQGVRLELQPPGTTSDPFKIVASHGADFGLGDLIDLSLARQRGLDLVAIAPIVQRPLGSVMTLAGSGIARPRDLEGKRVGLTGVPSDKAIVSSVIAADGGDPAKVDWVTIGFNAVPSLVAGSVDAAIGFWPADGVELQVSGHPVRLFKLDQYGAPPFPELVLFTRGELLRRDPALADRVVAAVKAGYAVAQRDPSAALADLEASAPGIEHRQAAAQLAAYRTIFSRPGAPFGVFDRSALVAFTRWLQSTGITTTPVDPAALAR